MSKRAELAQCARSARLRWWGVFINPEHSQKEGNISLLETIDLGDPTSPRNHCERCRFIPASDRFFSTEFLSIYVGGAENTKIHTSCSQPIASGLIKGDFKVISEESRNGGELCPVGNDR